MALISPPGVDPVDRQDVDGKNVGLNPGWRKFFNDVYTVLNGLVQSGSASNRPDNLLWVGKPYYDETLGQIVFWNGSYWSTTATTSPSASSGSAGFSLSDAEQGEQGPPGPPGPPGRDGVTAFIHIYEDAPEPDTIYMRIP